MTEPAYAAAVRSAWVAFITPLEGCIPHPYRDSIGIVTVGLGCALETPAAFCALPWLTSADLPALRAEVMTAWNFLHTIEPNRVASAYAYPGHLHLDAAEIEALAFARLDAAARILTARWPAFPTFPPQAQAALLSLSWAVGPGGNSHGVTGPEWPHLQAAVDAQDWGAAAVAGWLRWETNPGVRPRDFCDRALFMMAGGASLETARAWWPKGPAATSAWEALRPMAEAIDVGDAERAVTFGVGDGS